MRTVFRCVGLSAFLMLAAISPVLSDERQQSPAERLFEEANTLLSAGQYQEAIAKFGMALDIEPKRAAIWNNLALAYSRNGWDDQAIAAQKTAISLTPSESKYYLQLGAYYGVKLGILEWHTASDPVPISRSTSGRKPFVVEAKERDMLLAEIERAYTKAAELDPSAAESHFALGDIYYNMGRINEAASEFERTVKIDPRYTEGYFALGLCMLAINPAKLPEALGFFKKYVELGGVRSEAAKAFIAGLEKR